jgi:hypothetical protein
VASYQFCPACLDSQLNLFGKVVSSGKASASKKETRCARIARLLRLSIDIAMA